MLYVLYIQLNDLFLSEQQIITNYKKTLNELSYLPPQQQIIQRLNFTSSISTTLYPTPSKMVFQFCLPHSIKKTQRKYIFIQYLRDIEILSETQDKNTNVNFSQNTQEIFCVYEKNNYFDNKMKHIFDAIYACFLGSPNSSEKFKCQCNENIDQESSKYFISKVQTLNKCLNISKKNKKDESLVNNQQKINWYQFTKNLINQQLNIQSYSIPQQSLYLYKLPQTKDKNTAYIFNVLWNDNFLIFNNGNKLQINQNMKSKTVQLCQSIHKKLNQYIWRKIQTYIPRIAEQVSDPQHFIAKLKEKIKISTFKVWFYKKDANNQIYILNLSHLTFKGVQCSLYNDFNVKTETIFHQPSKNQRATKGQLKELNKSFQNKLKSTSISNKSYKTLKGLLYPSELQKMKALLDDKKFEVTPIQPRQIIIEDEQVSQIQCQCCKNLLTSKEVVNQITANHIEQIRYLRQIKIGKLQYNPYQFVKACTLCYNTYLQHYKRQSIDQKTQKKSTRNNSQSKNSQSFLQKGNYNFQNYKAKQNSFKIQNNSSKRLLFAKQQKERAKSQLNNSKEQPSFFGKQEKVMIRDRSISLRPPLNPPLNPKPKHKKVHTTNTTNTQNTILQQQFIEVTLIPRTRTQQQHSMTNHNSIKFKNPLPNKTHNLIHKIITNSVQSRKNNMPQFIDQQQQAIKLVNNKIIMNAIDQYQKIERFSFKKLITKNHRNYMIKQPPKQYSQVGDNQSIKWKQPLKSYFNNH